MKKYIFLNVFLYNQIDYQITERLLSTQSSRSHDVK